MTFIGELAAGRGIDLLIKGLSGPARRLWSSGPEGRLLVLLHRDYGDETDLQRDIFYSWQLDDALMTTVRDMIAGQLQPGPEAQRRLTESLIPKLIRSPDSDKTELAGRIGGCPVARRT